MELFVGVISNCKKEILMHTSGETKIESKRNWFYFWDMRVDGGGGNVTTTHEHYTDFEIDGVAFRCYGDLTFKDGDRVKFYATNSGKGYYIVNFLNNFTRGFYAGETPRTYGLLREVGVLFKLLAPMIGVSFFVAFFIAFILWGLFSFGFWKTFENSILVLLALSLIIIIAEFMKKDNGENIKNIYNTLTSDE